MKKTILFLILLNVSFTCFSQLKEVTYADGENKQSGFISKPSKALQNKPGI